MRNLIFAWRNVKKDKVFSFINIFGLSIGLSSCLLIVLFVKGELSYDSHYSKKDDIFRLVRYYDMKGTNRADAMTPAPAASVLKETYSEIDLTGRLLLRDLSGTGGIEVRGTQTTKNEFEEKFAYADNSLLEILEVKMINGDVNNALTTPNTLIISDRMAEKYFSDQEIINSAIIIDNDVENPKVVKGVFKAFPSNSHLDLDFIFTLEGKELYPGEEHSWMPHNFFTYIRIKPSIHPKVLEDKIQGLKETYYDPTFTTAGERNSEFVKSLNFKLQSVKDIHLRNGIVFDTFSHGDIRFVYLFSTIAVFILILACINFINLSTAKAGKRAKEIGVKKALGSSRHQQIVQFLSESIIFCFIAFCFAVIIAIAILPLFNSIADRNIEIGYGDLWLISVLILSTIVIGFLAGLYPAFYLSSFKPSITLKGTHTTSEKSFLRTSLVILQFATSVVLIICVITVHKQSNYILNKNLGYDKERVLVVSGTQEIGDRLEAFKQRINSLSEVTSVSVSGFLPVEGTKRNQMPFKVINPSNIYDVDAQLWWTDYDYIGTLGLSLLDGRKFSRDIASDSVNSIIINRSMAKALGFTNPIGRRVHCRIDYDIIGVVEDFHFTNLKDVIRPLAMVIGHEKSMVLVRTNTNDMERAISNVDNIWKEFMPNQELRYSFLDTRYALMHRDIEQRAKILDGFTLVALIVACLGLLALSTYLAEQRKKEISVRIVLGATFRDIYTLLSINFMKIVLVAVVIGIPLGGFLISRWIQDYAFRINIGWDIYVLSGTIALLAALLTVSFQAVSSALIDPMKSLRRE
ncbi:ABC transporter permease [Muricauda sp. SCSIO 64092]|uniref:ABC transporter permease n=1 Tax=Allomuricauda sp. SCSIO 64092 TaxID=2908842 RepID=UPI001FF68071|nr:ABC transporter permease [Muricauda sp. SCSIO 64092]UOY05368.1 ABC transporter permease [Muricauda sp. SCSIO 64092]